MGYVYLKLVNDEKCKFPLDVGGLILAQRGVVREVEEGFAKLLRAGNPLHLVYCDKDGVPLEPIPALHLKDIRNAVKKVEGAVDDPPVPKPEKPVETKPVEPAEPPLSVEIPKRGPGKPKKVVNADE